MVSIGLFVFFVVMVTATVTVSVCNYFTDAIMSSSESFIWNFVCALATAAIFIIVPPLSASNVDLPPGSQPVFRSDDFTMFMVVIGSIAGFALAWIIGVSFRRLGWRNYGKWRRD
ncbi:hypothetical protein [Dyella sp. 2HG41-7]|uniref:hypothetical protein n=1 Tax=Dyella sp. 2HG41-7 TaxID=2883239 RepID=UPI001F31EED9|nr:hypothetical protein [Dyella sp. 2HG41-7]